MITGDFFFFFFSITSPQSYRIITQTTSQRSNQPAHEAAGQSHKEISFFPGVIITRILHHGHPETKPVLQTQAEIPSQMTAKKSDIMRTYRSTSEIYS